MRVTFLVLAMLLLSPICNVNATSQDFEGEDLDIDERFILQSYSRAVQLAFERVSEIDAYSEDILAITKSWLVVTRIPRKIISLHLLHLMRLKRSNS